MEATKRPYSKKKFGENNKNKTCSSLNVINLTNVSLTQAQLDVLGRGLTYSPSANLNIF